MEFYRFITFLAHPALSLDNTFIEECEDLKAALLLQKSVQKGRSRETREEKDRGRRGAAELVLLDSRCSRYTSRIDLLFHTSTITTHSNACNTFLRRPCILMWAKHSTKCHSFLLCNTFNACNTFLRMQRQHDATQVHKDSPLIQCILTCKMASPY